MDVISIRKVNLQDLVARLTAGGRTQKQAAIDLDLAPSYLSQLLGGKKMGDDVARKIEGTHGLPHGWMDNLHHEVREEMATYGPSQSLRIDPETIASAVRLLRLTYQNLGLDDIDNEEDGTPLALAYEYLLRRGERLVTPDNLIDFSKALGAKIRGQDDGTQSARTGVVGGIGGSDRRTGSARKAS